MSYTLPTVTLTDNAANMLEDALTAIGVSGSTRDEKVENYVMDYLKNAVQIHKNMEAQTAADQLMNDSAQDTIVILNAEFVNQA